MAWARQERKREMAPVIKAICKKYGMKGSLSIRNHSCYVFTIKSGIIDFNNPQVSDTVNHLQPEKFYSGKALEFIKEISAEMEKGNYNNSDYMTDYFDINFYVNIQLGSWNKVTKPYIYQGV